MENSKDKSDYFSGYEELQVHRLMIADEVRTDTYKKAIMKNKHLFENKIVMDVGAGTGILSLFAAEAGAGKVYSIEASNLANLISSVAKDNGFEAVINVLHTKVENLHLKDKVDIIISEWMGFYLFHESMLSSIIFARDNFLKPDGTLFPTDCSLYACPCSIASIENETLKFWENVYGFNMKAIQSKARSALSLKPQIERIPSSNLLAEPVCITSLNLMCVELSNIIDISINKFVSIIKNGNYQGIVLYFKCDFNGIEFNEKGEEVGEIVTLSTSPYCPPTHWKQTLVVFDEKYQSLVEEDDIVGFQISLKQSEDDNRKYNITIEELDPASEVHPIPCECGCAKCIIISNLLEKENDL